MLTLLSIYLLCVWGGAHAYLRSGDNLWESGLSFYHVDLDSQVWYRVSSPTQPSC